MEATRDEGIEDRERNEQKENAMKVGEYFLSEWVGHVTLFRCTNIMRTGRPVVDRWHKGQQCWTGPRPLRSNIPLQTIRVGEARSLMKSREPYVMEHQG
jgi:hypothetical protein